MDKFNVTISSDGPNGKSSLMKLIAEAIQIFGYDVTCKENGEVVGHKDGGMFSNGKAVEINVIQ